MTYISAQSSLFIQNKELSLEADSTWHSPSPVRPSHALIFFCKTIKITTNCWTIIDRKTLEPNNSKGLGIPREFHFEGQQDLTAGLSQLLIGYTPIQNINRSFFKEVSLWKTIQRVKANVKFSSQSLLSHFLISVSRPNSPFNFSTFHRKISFWKKGLVSVSRIICQHKCIRKWWSNEVQMTKPTSGVRFSNTENMWLDLNHHET